MGINEFGYFLVAIAAVTSYVALRSAFPLFKFGASVMWIVIWMWIRANPPAGTEGQPFHIVALLGAIVMVVAFMLAQLGKDVRQQKDFRSGLDTGETEASEGFKFKLPNWMKTATGETQKQRTERKEERIEDYRKRVHKALNPRRGKK